VFEETTATNSVVRTSIGSCDDVATPCWRIEPDNSCPGTLSKVVVDRGTIPPPPHTRITVLCETCKDPKDPLCAF
jgi:hypothetical protein